LRVLLPGDRAAQELGVPLLPPSKAKNATFHRGANFAITGATSLDTPFFVERGLGKTVWNSGSLHTQIQWFQDMKPKLCGQEQECRDLFRRSLFIVGEFGGNDYNSPLFAFRPLAEAHDMVPHVVESIGRGVERLIAEGAAELVVPGVLPIGCFPVYLSIFRRQPAGGYGARSGCVKELNTLSWVHNAALRRKVEELRARHPGVRIVYADYYTPAIQFVLHAEKYGMLFIRLRKFVRSRIEKSMGDETDDDVRERVIIEAEAAAARRWANLPSIPSLAAQPEPRGESAFHSDEKSTVLRGQGRISGRTNESSVAGRGGWDGCVLARSRDLIDQPKIKRERL
jgi:hypothetical protein